MSMPMVPPAQPPRRQRSKATWLVVVALGVALAIGVGSYVADSLGVGTRQWACQSQAQQLLGRIPGVSSVHATCVTHIEYITQEVEVVIDSTSDDSTVSVATAVLTAMAESKQVQEWDVPRFRRQDGQSTSVIWTRLGISPRSAVMEVARKWGITPR